MKEMVAFHEAAHIAVTLNSCVRERIQSARVFELNGQWFGECVIAYEGTRLSAAEMVASLGVDVAGPLVQLLLHPDTVPTEVREAVEQNKGLLAASWWLLVNKPKVQFNWGLDMNFWLNQRKWNENLALERYYETETVVHRWLADEGTQDALKNIVNLLNTHDALSRDALLAINIDGFPPLDLPSYL